MLHFPALVDLATQAHHPLGLAESFLVGRNETADVCVLDVTCSRHHFRIVRRDGQHFVEPLNQANPTFVNGQPVQGPTLLGHGAVLQVGRTRFQFQSEPPAPGVVDSAAGLPLAGGEGSTVMVGQAPGAIAVGGDTVLKDARFPLAGAMLIGRERAQVHIHLPHLQVSRLHARIVVHGATAQVTDLHSANGTFINGRRIAAEAVLEPGDHLDIGPYALRFNFSPSTGAALVTRARSDNVELVARGVRRCVRDRTTGQPLVLLDGITLVIRPREFVCLLGPSGSGKSTLLATLSGRAMANEGSVLVNGRDLHANFAALKQDIAVVPQRDVLHEALSVEQALWYTAKLRLPPDTSPPEIGAAVTDILETVGLGARRHVLIRHLSGGQAKRASLANEILCKPSLLFLDEVTSGLDEQTDREVMNLFRDLADAGKTVVCVTHSLANVERTCHLVVVLTPGGKLAFAGKPSEALEHFGIDRLGEVYDRLAERPPEHWQQQFIATPLFGRYVHERLPAGNATPTPVQVRPAGKRRDRIRLFFRQTRLLTQRYAAIWRGDFLSLLTMLAQALVVAILLGILFGNLDDVSDNPPEHARRTVNLMFLLGVSCFWFGCNNAAKEIVKERVIYTRERDFNLLVESYYASKLLLLALFSGVQAVVLFTMVRGWCDPPGPVADQISVLLALALAGVALGLAISAFAPTEEMAITLIPMAVIPQIILSGVVSPLEGVSKILALAGVSTYWGKRGLDASLPETVAQAFPPGGVEQHSTNGAILVLLLHAAVGIAVALAALHWQNRRRRAP